MTRIGHRDEELIEAIELNVNFNANDLLPLEVIIFYFITRNKLLLCPPFWRWAFSTAVNLRSA